MSDSPEADPNAADMRLRRQRARSLAIALVLGALVVLFYLVTIVKMGPAILKRPI